MTTSLPSRAVYTAAVESVSRGVLQALTGAGPAFCLADQVWCVGDRTAGLVALRVLGADAVLPFRLGLAPWSAEDAELMTEGLARFALPAPESRSDGGPCVTVPALRDWATREALAQLGTPGMRQPFPGLPPAPDPGWPAWSARLAQLSPLAGLGAATPIPGLVVARARDTARGLSRALLRADRLTAARLARWMSVARATSGSEVDAWTARDGVHVEAARRQLELGVDEDEVHARLELAAGSVPLAGPGPDRPGTRVAGRALPDAPSPPATPDAHDRVASAREIARRGWTWLEECLPHFALPDDASLRELHPDRHLKPLGEFALCASVALRDGETGRGAEAARTLLRFGWEQLGHGELLAGRQRRCPAEVSDPFALESYVHFARAGYRHAELETLLVHQAGLRAAGAAWEPPERVLSVIAARALLGLDEPLRLDHVVPATWLGCRPEPWSATLPALYAMTHVVYYLTDWGAHPERLPAELADYLGCWLPVWLEIYLEVDNWDIVGELLLVDLCLPEPHTPDLAWRRLRDAQQSDGLVPADAGTTIGTGRFAALNHYHTTGVLVSAASLALARHRGTVNAQPVRSGLDPTSALRPGGPAAPR